MNIHMNSALMCAAVAVLAKAAIAGPIQPAQCERTSIQTESSPDNRWIASVVQSVCDLGLSSSATALVELRSRTNPNLQQTIIGTDLPSRIEDFPRVSWLSPGKIKVVVAAGTVFGVRTAEYQGIQVEVVYCPEDPVVDKALKDWQAAYQRWLDETTAWNKRKKVNPALAEPKPIMPQPPVRPSVAACLAAEVESLRHAGEGA